MGRADNGLGLRAAHDGSSQAELINSVAVVVYLSDGLARFVDELRREFTPGCPHRAHITVLPPRPLSVGVSEAVSHCGQVACQRENFQVRLREVDLFESTQVIKLSVAEGCTRLIDLHSSLNTGLIHCNEPFQYIPHITLAQELPKERVQEYLAYARARWAAFQPAPPIAVDELTFVQQQANECWHDVAHLPLRQLEPVGVRRD